MRYFITLIVLLSLIRHINTNENPREIDYPLTRLKFAPSESGFKHTPSARDCIRDSAISNFALLALVITNIWGGDLLQQPRWR